MNAVVAFSYDAVSTEISTELRIVAERIRERGRRATADMLEIGRDLLKVKERLKHRQFLDWIAGEFSMNARTAQRLMRAAEWAEAKNDTVSHLPATVIYELSARSTPPEIGTEVVAALAAGERIDPREISERVRQERALAAKARRGAQRRARREDHLKPETIKRQERKAERDRAETERRQREQDDAVAEVVAILERRLSPDERARVCALMQTGGWWRVAQALAPPAQDRPAPPARPQRARRAR